MDVVYGALKAGHVLVDGERQAEVLSVERTGSGWVAVAYQWLGGECGCVDRRDDHPVEILAEGPAPCRTCKGRASRPGQCTSCDVEGRI